MIESEVVALIADSDHRQKRFRCLEPHLDDPFMLTIEYMRKLQMTFELISSGNRRIGISEVLAFTVQQILQLGGESSVNSSNFVVDSHFSVNDEFFHFRYLFNSQPNGDISRLTVQGPCPPQDFHIIKHWFQDIKLSQSTLSLGEPGEFTQLVA